MDDLISRQDAIEAIASRDETNGTVKVFTGRQVNEILASLPAADRPRGEWIPCDERLPKKNCRYLTTNTAWGEFEVDWNVWIDGQWLYANNEPVAWMPLPEPWKSERMVTALRI